MNKNQSQERQDSAPTGETSRQPQTAQPFRRACAGMRAVPGFDQETGRLAGVTLTRRPPREGASVGVHTGRLDLDDAIPVQRGWHWFGDRQDIVCELTPTIQDVLEQVAEDVFQDRLADYQLNGYDPAANAPRFGDLAEQLREVATRRMSLPPDEAEFQCARLLRQYQDHLRRVEDDDD